MPRTGLYESGNSGQGVAVLPGKCRFDRVLLPLLLMGRLN